MMTTAISSIIVMLSAFAANAESKPQQVFKQLDENSDGYLTAAEVGKAKAAYFKRLLRIGDANKDGKLTAAEFEMALNKKYAAGGGSSPGDRPRNGRRPIPFSRDAFNRLDRSKDGKLTMKELPATLRPRFKPLFDRSKKTALTYAEIVAILRPPSRSFQQRIDALFVQLDINKDGKITVAEQKDARYKRYLQFQLRQSGKKSGDSLSKAEFLAVVQKQAAVDGARVREALQQSDKDRDGTISKTEATGRLKQFFDRFDRNKNGKLEPPELAAALRYRDTARRKKKQ